jgi:hypothetical protein
MFLSANLATVFFSYNFLICKFFLSGPRILLLCIRSVLFFPKSSPNYDGFYFFSNKLKNNKHNTIIWTIALYVILWFYYKENLFSNKKNKTYFIKF